jgi:hypothetical protein
LLDEPFISPSPLLTLAISCAIIMPFAYGGCANMVILGMECNMPTQMGIFQVIYLNRSAEEAFKPLSAFKPFVPFRDASCGVSTFHLTVLDVIKVRGSGIQRNQHVRGMLTGASGHSISTNCGMH